MRSVIVTFIALGLLAGCGPKGKQTTMEKGKLHTDMWKLVTLVGKLDKVLKDEVKEPSQQKVVGLLSEMDTIAKRLGSNQGKRHPLIEDSIDEFQIDIVSALKAAQHTPPNYYYSGKVTGACILCHDPKGGIR